MDSFLRSDQFVGLMGMLTGIPFFGVLVIGYYWYKLRVKQWEMSLKHTMLERGMSADEIKAVLEASVTGGEKKMGCWSHQQHSGTDV